MRVTSGLHGECTSYRHMGNLEEASIKIQLNYDFIKKMTRPPENSRYSLHDLLKSNVKKKSVKQLPIDDKFNIM